MSGPRFLLGAALVLTAVLLETTTVTRLPLPGVAPDLVLVLVVAFAFVEGPLSGMASGFCAGLLADLLAYHQLGRLALAYCAVGYLTGMAQDDTERSTFAPFLAVGLGAVAGLVIYAAEGFLLGDARVTIAAVGRGLLSAVPYDVVLTPFVVPLVATLVRRVEQDAVRR